MGAATWEPTPGVLHRSMTARFMAQHGIATYDSLVSRSIENPEWFWRSVVGFLGLPFQRDATRVRDDSAGVSWTTWWPDGDLNLAAVCLDRWADDPSHSGLPHPVKGEVIGLWFVASRTNEPDAPACSALGEAVAEAVMAAFGRPFRPAHVDFVEALPQTRSAKVVRRAVRARATGTDPGDLSMLEDPSVLDAIDPVVLG